MPPMLLPLFAQAAPSPAHVGMDASFTIPVLLILATAVAFGIRLEMRQHSLAKDVERQEKDHGKRLDKLEADQEAHGARVGQVELSVAVHSEALGRIESGVARIERRIDEAIANGSSRQSGA